MEVTMNDIKKLREMTGAGLAELTKISVLLSFTILLSFLTMCLTKSVIHWKRNLSKVS